LVTNSLSPLLRAARGFGGLAGGFRRFADQFCGLAQFFRSPSQSFCGFARFLVFLPLTFIS
jgi:hypothetical protein